MTTIRPQQFLPDDTAQKLIRTNGGNNRWKIIYEANQGKIPLRVGTVVFPSSLRTSRDCGIGPITNLEYFAAAAAQMGISLIQLPPLGAKSPRDHDDSPYNASDCAFDPLLIDLRRIVQMFPRVQQVLDENRAEIDRLNRTENLDLEETRKLYDKVLGAAFEEFLIRGMQDSGDFRAFVQRGKDQENWLEEFAEFAVLRDHFHGIGWWDWGKLSTPGGAAYRDMLGSPEMQKGRLYYKFVQWLIDGPMAYQGERCRKLGVTLAGDLPYLPGKNTATVYHHQDQFHLDLSAGALPWFFGRAAENWHLFPRVMLKTVNDPRLFTRSAKHLKALGFDELRVDYVNGLFNPYVFNGNEEGWCYFHDDFYAYLNTGRALLKNLLDFNGGLGLCGETIGIPLPGINDALDELGVCQMKVLRWLRNWDFDPAQSYFSPEHHPLLSWIFTSTHDIEPHGYNLLQTLQQSDHERDVLRRFLGWNDLPTYVKDELYEQSLARLLGGAAYTVMVPAWDLISLNWGYRDLGEQLQVNYHGTENTAHCKRNWSRCIPDAELLFNSIGPYAVVGDKMRGLAIGSGRTPTPTF